MKHDDCFEKKDLIARVQEYKDRKNPGAGSSSGAS
jgi:hypothetical protein